MISPIFARDPAGATAAVQSSVDAVLAFMDVGTTKRLVRKAFDDAATRFENIDYAEPDGRLLTRRPTLDEQRLLQNLLRQKNNLVDLIVAAIVFDILV